MSVMYQKEEINYKLTNQYELELHFENWQNSDQKTRTHNIGKNKQLKNVIEKYIDFELKAISNDKINKTHNFGRVITFPINSMLNPKKSQKTFKKACREAIKNTSYMKEFKKSSISFSYVEENEFGERRIVFVFIERAMINKTFTDKKTYFKTKHYYKFHWLKIHKIIVENWKHVKEEFFWVFEKEKLPTIYSFYSYNHKNIDIWAKKTQPDIFIPTITNNTKNTKENETNLQR